MKPPFSRALDRESALCDVDQAASTFQEIDPELSELQSRQLAWLDRWSRTERNERLRCYYLKCRTCGTEELDHVATVAAHRLIQFHLGHKTWIKMYPGSKARGRIF